jgi:NADH:ubiquinone oxidoreductase subunit C
MPITAGILQLGPIMEEKVRAILHSRIPDAVIKEVSFRGDQSFYVRPEFVLPIMQALLDDLDVSAHYLCDITSVDWLGNEQEMGGRFEVIYNLYSLTHRYRFFLKFMLPADNPEIDSLTPLFNSANWLEREVWDVMGIRFTGHPDLTKIITADELAGHPLRRDFPLTYEVPQFSWNKDDPPEVIR